MERKSLSTEIVLDRAVELAKQNGIDSITYNGLARELGIRPQSMYRYVSDIKKLRTELLSRFLNELVDSIESTMKGLSDKEALRAFAISMYDECHKHPWYYQTFELMHQYDIIPDLNEPLMRLESLVYTRMQLLTKDEENTNRLTQMFVALNLGYAQMSMTRFIPTSLADSREMFIKSIDEFIQIMKF